MLKNRNSSPFSILILTLVFLCCTGFTAAMAGDFDFAKTKAHVHEYDAHPEFPISMLQGRDFVYSIYALGEKIDSKKRQQVEAFVSRCQLIDGGFVSDKHEKETSILFTDVALDTFSMLNSHPSADLQRTKTFILSLKNADGGFGFNAKTKQSALVNTYYAVHSLSLLNSLKEVDAAKTAAFIKEFEKKGGGFNYVKQMGDATAKFTYMSLYTLKALGKLDAATKANALKFFKSTGYVKGNDAKVDPLHMLEEMGYTIDALKLLGATDLIDKKKAKGILDQLYIKQTGGFGSIPGYVSTPATASAGIHILAGIGTLKEPKTYPLVKK